MGMKHFKAYTPSRRNMTVLDYSEITKKTPEKSLITTKKEKAGRNAQGKITVRHQGGGNRQKYRIIDFKRNKVDMPATVIGIEYDQRKHSFNSIRRRRKGIYISTSRINRWCNSNIWR